MKIQYVALATMLALVCLVGCNSGVPRSPVSGSVTLDEKPLKEGSILFIPLSDGPSAGGDIKDGRYELKEEDGPGLGRYRVEINSWVPGGRGIKDAATGETEQDLVSIVPPQYNRDSELEVEVTNGENNTFDFELKPSS